MNSSILVGYGNGPGWKLEENATEMCDRRSPSADKDKWGDPDNNSDFVYPSAAYAYSESHGGEDVPLYAQGPMVKIRLSFVREKWPNGCCV